MKRNNSFGLSSFSALSTVKRLCIVFCLALMLGAEGCRDDLEVSGTDTSRPKDSFSVSIALAGMGSEQTRAAGDAGEDSEDTNGAFGTADENYIDINDLYVMTFSIPEDANTLTGDSELLEVLWNGKNKGKANDTGIYFNGSTAYLNTWLDAKIPAYKPENGKDFCLVAIANFSRYTKTVSGAVPLAKGTKFSALQAALKYNFDNKAIVNKGIPLFGVKRVNLQGYDKKVHNVANPFILKSNENGNPTLWMLRAFSKVEVALSEELLKMQQSMGPITIQSASVNKYGSTFWVIPELDRMSGFYSTGGTGQLKDLPSSNYQSEGENETQLYFTINEDGKSCVAYLPEYILSTDTDKKYEITLTLKFGVNTQEFKFDIKYYGKENEEMSKSYWRYLMRNHLYKYLVDIGFKIISVVPSEWDNTFDNEFNLGTPT